MLSGQRMLAELREAIGSNLEELQQMAQMVNDMLFLARADLAADRMLTYCEFLLDEAGLAASRTGGAWVDCSAALVQRALVRLAVENPGPPIPDEVRTRMLDRFFASSAPMMQGRVPDKAAASARPSWRPLRECMVASCSPSTPAARTASAS